MCAVCYHSPCLRRCPNADIPVFDVCGRCGNDIEHGDRYAQIDGKPICENFLDNMTLSQILDLFDTCLEEAQ
ncbi:MAG: hypothetical protein IKN04_11175 [Clostridia bacterium]|nr:hypothetical protein [Clostridia bacterium]